MMKYVKYFRLFRFTEQYPFFGSAIAAGIFLGKLDLWILLWGFSSALISACGFAVNELVDGQDVDKKSWNPIHVAAHAKLDPTVVAAFLFAFLSAGLSAAWFLGVFGWGLAVFLLWSVYSVPPFRLKSVPVLDLATQLVTGIWLPFAAVLYHFGWQWDPQIIILLVPLSCFLLLPVFEYQLADYTEDKKYGLRSTHVLLGMDGSIRFGMLLGILGVLLFFLLGTWRTAAWGWVLVPFSLYSLYHLHSVQLVPTLSARIKKFQTYVMIVKPASWLVVPFLFWWWLFIR